MGHNCLESSNLTNSTFSGMDSLTKGHFTKVYDSDEEEWYWDSEGKYTCEQVTPAFCDTLGPIWDNGKNVELACLNVASMMVVSKPNRKEDYEKTIPSYLETVSKATIKAAHSLKICIFWQ